MSLFKHITPVSLANRNASWEGKVLKFSLFAEDAESVEYLFYSQPYQMEEDQSYPLLGGVTLTREKFCFGNLWNWEGVLSDSIPHNRELGYVIRLWKKNTGNKKEFRWIIDPYARESAGAEIWGKSYNFKIDSENYHISKTKRKATLAKHHIRRLPVIRPRVVRQVCVSHPFHPMDNSIIYECHVRGMTQSPSAQLSNSQYAGTYRGLTEYIPHLKELGITAVELLPVCDFDETENPKITPKTGEKLYNFWGYSSLLFFAPKQSYAYDKQNPVQEFKDMVEAFHAADMEVILDVVYNHTAELGHGGPVDHFKWLGQRTYYMHDSAHNMANYSGCGNTMNCSHPVVKQMIIDSLRYWANEIGVDGFRFDLASILTRSPEGDHHTFPYIWWEIKHDPALSGIKLIAEPWDAGGGYHLGHVSRYAEWAEWNDRFRDNMRKAIRGDLGTIAHVKNALLGSPEIYGSTSLGRQMSINFLTAHDGMTLWDLMSYNEKNNEQNREGNTDGVDENYSNNCGEEGPSNKPEINALRRKKMRTAHLLLQLSNGIPMLLAGDEFSRTQSGNNNAYCLDNTTTWVDWELLNTNRELFEFVKNAINFRRDHFVFMFSEKSQYDWYNSQSESEDLGHYIRTLMWKVTHPDFPGRVICVLFNFFEEPLEFRLPGEDLWDCVFDTALERISPSTKKQSGTVKVKDFSIQVYKQE